ncbi:MAG: hypothetical protein ThorAB25_22080 [Candidatus Thorarchaeota archaeon AB_25]|nr:MAG: hypothetical protein ThorAB25_22080 [Candidatus Thorarchaeota archaeon AB_25]
MPTKDSSFREPKVTTSILASIPDCLHNMLQENVQRTKERRTSILVSSNNLANRFILERWRIRSSQRRRYKNLFSTIRKQCRALFRNYLSRGNIVWKNQNSEFSFGVFKFDEVRGNLILGFVPPCGYLNWRFVSDKA